MVDGGSQAPCFRIGKLQISKELENEAEPWTALPSGSKLLLSGLQSPVYRCYDQTAPATTWPFLFLPVMIPVAFPAWIPPPARCICPFTASHLTWELIGPLEDCDPVAPHSQEAAPPSLAAEPRQLV